MVLRRGRRRRYVARLGVCLALLVAAWCAVTFVSLRHAAGEGGEALLMPPGGGGVRGARGAAEAPREAALARACAQRWALRTGDSLGAGGRGLFFRFAPKGIDDRYEQTCDGALRPPSQPGAAGQLERRPLVHLRRQGRRHLRRRGRRRAGAGRRRRSAGAPLAPNRSDAALRLFGDFPAAAPKHVRCCGEEEDPGGCVWRPTLLERTEGSGTAEALERAAAQQEAAVLRGEASWIERREGKKVRRDPAEALARLRDAAREEDVPEDPRDAFRRSWARKRRARGRRVLGEEEPSSRDAKNLRSAILEEIVRRREVEIAALKNAEADPLYVADLGDDDGAKRLKAEAKAAFTRIVTLPKVIPANATAPWKTAIPRVIFQTFRSRSVPFRLHEAVMSWSRANPAYEHRIFDDDDMGAFVVETFGWDSREIRALNAAPGARARTSSATSGAALAVDNLLRSSGNLPRKRGAKKAGAFPKNFTARPPNVVPVFRGLRRVFREDPPADLAAEPALAAAAARDRETEGGYDVEARWECPVANVNQIGDEGLAGPPVLQAALEAFARKDGSPDPAVARATANRPLSLAERFAVRAAFHELVSLRPPEFGAAINSKYADEQSYKDDLATAGVKHWSDAWAEYDMGI
ncbi:hypothetical protein JL721_4319 [Aureococcus anophagefferens]|nr:hypothetical protein JL721_4319 [Aureococcus anophagefferens]